MTRTKSYLAQATFLLLLGHVRAAGAETVVQLPLPGLLDARSVTTLTNDQLVVFTLPTDGGGLQNAFATAAVAMRQGKPVANALPDDGRFPATARHPEVVLHFSNAAEPTSPQTRLVAPSTSFDFDVPAASYSKLFLFFNGAAGGVDITVTLNYSDAMEMKSANVPDYYADISATDPVIFNLATGLAKYDKNTQINEADHHNITGVELALQPAKTLSSVKVERALEGNLVFWGATAVATGDVPLGGAGGAGGMVAGGAGGGAGEPANGGGGAAGSGMSGSSPGGFGGVPGAGGGAAGSAGAGSGVPPSAGAAATGSSSDAGGCRLGVGQPGSRPAWLVLVLAAGLGVARRSRRRASHRLGIDH